MESHVAALLSLVRCDVEKFSNLLRSHSHKVAEPAPRPQNLFSYPPHHAATACSLLHSAQKVFSIEQMHRAKHCGKQEDDLDVRRGP